ncbi:putative GEM-like protein [Helianthus annuus]|nr:putative GEM-like protein [Helianthus annuus]
MLFSHFVNHHFHIHEIHNSAIFVIVSIPLGKIKGVEESMNIKMSSNKYVELVTVDDFSFWFLGFPNSKKTLRSLRQAINQSRLLTN